jgi:hypothetical protein
MGHEVFACIPHTNFSSLDELKTRKKHQKSNIERLFKIRLLQLESMTP